jgi:hypothetical protein
MPTLPKWNAREARTLARIRSLSTFRRYTQFLTARDAIRREGGAPYVTDDPILRRYRFTNIRREWDFTTQWLITHWYTPLRKHPHVGRMCALARWINHVPSLEAIGIPTDDDWHRYVRAAERTLARRRAQGHKIFTSAYIIGGIPKGEQKLEFVLRHALGDVWKAGHLDTRWPSLDLLHRTLHAYRGWGDFLTQEVVCDFALTSLSKGVYDRDVYGFAGPGAKRGLNRMHGRPARKALPRQQAVTEMLALYNRIRRDVRGEVPTAWRQTLTVHDVEFTLCEFDKYERVLHSEGVPKQLYTPRTSAQRSFFSPDDRPADGDLEA